MIQSIVMFLLISGKYIDIPHTDVEPHIDGFIEDTWNHADSVDDFIQSVPYEQQLPTERTVVYVLQSNRDLYCAVRCYSASGKPTVHYSENDDYVTLYLDPFGSKSTAYYFKVYASGMNGDGWILDDGRSSDDSWDGVWEKAVKVYDDRYEVEMKIPFKSIRYKKELSEWGINFKRYIASKQETAYWTEVLQVEGNLVSKYGALRNIHPRTSGYYFELYPEFFMRSEKEATDPWKTSVSGSMNLKWDITPQVSLNATTFPDFAQIESDPYTLNLSQYETYLDERRPFFLEGKEIFRMPDFGAGKAFFSPLTIYYSRRIGKSMYHEAVPILGGLKLTGKSQRWNFGFFGTYTDSLETEPHRGFGVLRLQHKLLKTSDIGLLCSGTRARNDDYNYALGFDGVFRSGFHQFIYQTAVSDKNNKKGWALSSGYMGFIKNFLTMGGVSIVHDSFDVGEIGYVPWSGLKKAMLCSGPFKTYSRGFIKNLWIGSGIAVIQVPGDSVNWSTLGLFILNPNFRNNWGCNLELNIGSYYEANMHYVLRAINVSIWGNGAKYGLNIGGNYSYGYNYYRNFLAYQGANWFSFEYNLLPRINVSLSSNIWVEWDTTNTICAMTPVITPRIDFTITPTMTIGIFNECVMTVPETNFSEAEVSTNRLGVLFSWNFQPKSWFYIALNDCRGQDEFGNLQLQNQIGAIKIKYLVYF